LRAVEDHHVDRPEVEAQQCVQLTGTNRSIGLIPPHVRISPPGDILTPHAAIRRSDHKIGLLFLQTHSTDTQQTIALEKQHRPELCETTLDKTPAAIRSRHPVRSSLAWWPWRGANTRSHPELGRENPQRRWYCVLRRGRVGRRQACQERTRQDKHQHPSSITTHNRGVEQPGSSSGS
jgi:hypothetical protein